MANAAAMLPTFGTAVAEVISASAVSKAFFANNLTFSSVSAEALLPGVYLQPAPDPAG